MTLLNVAALSLLAFATILTGTWQVTSVNSDGSPIKAEMKIDESAALKVTLALEGNPVEVKKASREKDTLTLVLNVDENEVTVKVQLKDANTLEGTWSVPSGESAPVKAVRQ